MARSVSADPLPSWNDGSSRDAIIGFGTRVTATGGPEFIPASERIAVFDNDGTLWAEQPVYFQLMFIVDRVKAMSPQNPEWRTLEPYASILKDDVRSALAGGEPAIAALLAATHAGMTTDEFEKVVCEWMSTARHPKTGRLLTEMVYQPMLELLAYLRAQGFKTFIVSGGGIEFMRPWAERIYGIPPEQVVGTSGGLRYEVRDGRPVLVKLAELVHFDDKEGKPIGIQRHIGRIPIAAFGNSDGDLRMLEWTAAGAGPRLCVYIHHTDAEREWAYDRESSIGRLDKGLDEARRRDWTVVNMRSDWATVFPPASPARR
ncbi:MAG: HAD family hydrolase [Phycisphaerales bacterium]